MGSFVLRIFDGNEYEKIMTIVLQWWVDGDSHGGLVVNLTFVHSAHVSFAASGASDSLTDEVVEVGSSSFLKYHQSPLDKIDLN